jgi:hypothetical protein
MAIQISIESLATPGPPEERLFANLVVDLNGETYKWATFIPISYLNRYDEYIETIKDKIEQQILAKEVEWQALEPKTRVIPSPLGGEDMVVNIQKEEIVRPNIPDYYSLRRNEYPSLGDQIDAMWKGTSSPEYLALQQKIQEIKNKYPKD